MLAQDKITAIYYFIDELLKSMPHQEDKRRKMNDSEVITTAIVSSLYFGGHCDNARAFMKMSGNVPSMLDKSRYNRRLHALAPLLFSLFDQVGHYLKAIAGASDFIIDSFPVPVCDNMRISRSRLVKGEQFRGRHSSMRRYFYGIKVQVLCTAKGIPVELCFVPGSEADVNALKKLPMTVGEESNIYADAAYTDYNIEDEMLDAEHLYLKVSRKRNAKRKDKPWQAFIKEYMRKPIETAFSGIKALFLRKIHAVSFKGFLLKMLLFVFAFTLDKILL